MALTAQQKRTVAETCFAYAINGDYMHASRTRQQAYALNPPGSIGVNWDCWEEIWARDSRYLDFLNLEDFSDVDNSPRKIESLKVGIFIDYLFDFKDCWGVRKQSTMLDEAFRSEALESFLKANAWDFKSENREIIYTQTKKQNISAKIYYESIIGKGLNDTVHPHIYENGEYYLGFYPGTPESTINARRSWLKIYDEFINMSNANIDKFPKTFQTYHKHKLANSAKYQAWIAQYEVFGRGQKEVIP